MIAPSVEFRKRLLRVVVHPRCAASIRVFEAACHIGYTEVDGSVMTQITKLSSALRCVRIFCLRTVIYNKNKNKNKVLLLFFLLVLVSS